MADTLFPVFDISDLEEEEEEVTKYQPSAYFDFEKGDFALDGAHRIKEAAGKQAYIQWCMKVVDTERNTCLAYSDDIGTEIEPMYEMVYRQERENQIRDTITDALMVHPCTEYVRGFTFRHTADSCEVSFIVKGVDLDEETLSTVISNR